MEEKHEGTPNPLNPDLEPDTPNKETSGPVTEDAPKPEEKPTQSIKIVDVSETTEDVDAVKDTDAPEGKIEKGSEDISTSKEMTSEKVELRMKETEATEEHEIKSVTESEAETPKEKKTKINVVEVEETKEALTEPQDEQMPEPTSEENAYQPPQEVETPKQKSEPDPDERSFDIPKGPVVSESAAENDDFASLKDTDKSAPVIDMVKSTKPAGSVEEDSVMEENYITEPAEQVGMMAGMGAGMVSSQMNLDPTNRPMEKASMITQPPKRNRKKTGLIIGMVVSLFIAVGCGVAAVLIFMNNGNREDPVAMAMSRVMNGEAPKNVGIDGTVSIEVEDQASPISDLEINLKGEMNTVSMMNSASATLTVNSRNGGDSMKYKLDEVYTANGDLYFKIGGMENIVTESGTTYLEEGVVATEESPTNSTSAKTEELLIDCLNGPEGTDCAGVVESAICEEGEEGCSVTEVPTGEITPLLTTFSMLNMVDGEWIRVPLNSSEISSNGDTTEGGLGCTASLVSGIRNNSRTVANIYGTYPFVMAAADQKTTIASAGNPVYQVIVDANGFADFASELKSSNALNDWTTCVGDKNASATIESLVEAAGNLPEIYVEIDDNYNFTRLYLATEIWGEEDCCPDGAECLRACDEELKEAVTVDLNFTYPSSVDVSEPTEYRDLSDVMQGLFSEMYVTDTTGENGSGDTGNGSPQG